MAQNRASGMRAESAPALTFAQSAMNSNGGVECTVSNDTSELGDELDDEIADSAEQASMAVRGALRTDFMLVPMNDGDIDSSDLDSVYSSQSDLSPALHAAKTIQRWYRHVVRIRKFRSLVLATLEQHGAPHAEGRAQLILDHTASLRFKDSIDKKRLGKKASLEEMHSRLGSIASLAFDDILALQELDREEEVNDLTSEEIMAVGVAKFNRKPEKGLAFLVKHGVLSADPPRLARFMVRHEKLSKIMIGEFLGEKTTRSLAVLKEIAALLHFNGLPFVEALRTFLNAFRLPGEAQKIDRIMQIFAESYCRQNPNYFSDPDTAYVLAFSIIMLNTDQHNPSVARRMTKADFIRNNRGIDNGKDLPAEQLSEIFDNLVAKQLTTVDATMERLHRLCAFIQGLSEHLTLAMPYRELNGQLQVIEVFEPNEKPRVGKNVREIFIFNDVVVIGRITTSGTRCRYSDHYFLHATTLLLPPKTKYYKFNLILQDAVKKDRSAEISISNDGRFRELVATLARLIKLARHVFDDKVAELRETLGTDWPVSLAVSSRARLELAEKRPPSQRDGHMFGKMRHRASLVGAQFRSLSDQVRTPPGPLSGVSSFPAADRSPGTTMVMASISTSVLPSYSTAQQQAPQSAGMGSPGRRRAATLAVNASRPTSQHLFSRRPSALQVHVQSGPDDNQVFGHDREQLIEGWQTTLSLFDDVLQETPTSNRERSSLVEDMKERAEQVRDASTAILLEESSAAQNKEALKQISSRATTLLLRYQGLTGDTPGDSKAFEG